MVAIVAAAPAAPWRSTSPSMASPVSSARSPLITTAVSSPSSSAAAAATASPVPRGCSWIATSTPSGSARRGAASGCRPRSPGRHPRHAPRRPPTRSAVSRTMDAGPWGPMSACGCPRRQRGSRQWVQAPGHRSIGATGSPRSTGEWCSWQHGALGCSGSGSNPGSPVCRPCCQFEVDAPSGEPANMCSCRAESRSPKRSFERRSPRLGPAQRCCGRLGCAAGGNHLRSEVRRVVEDQHGALRPGRDPA